MPVREPRLCLVGDGETLPSLSRVDKVRSALPKDPLAAEVEEDCREWWG